MTDLEDCYATRIDDVRGMWEFDFTDANDRDPLPAVTFVHNDAAMVLLPMAAQGLLAIEIISFRNGEQVASRIVTLEA